MNKQLAYSAISTKIRAMGSSLITPAMYEDISCLPTVTEFVTYLKQNTVYGSIFNNIDETTLHRGQIERMLGTCVYRDYIKIYRFSDKLQREFLSCYFKSFEINIIKKCLRLTYSGNDDTTLPAVYDDFFMHHSRLNVPKMYDAKNITELMDGLKDSEYYSLFERCGGNGNAGSFDYETALDKYYFKLMWKSINKKLPSPMKESLMNIYGAKIDLLNIQWIYRGQFYYNLPPEKLLDMVIPITYHQKTEEINALLECRTTDEFNSRCQNNYYFRHYHLNDVSQLDTAYNTIIHSICTKESQKDPYSITCVYAYIINREYEIKKLTKALECIRYRLEPFEIMKYLNGGLYK